MSDIKQHSFKQAYSLGRKMKTEIQKKVAKSQWPDEMLRWEIFSKTFGYFQSCRKYGWDELHKDQFEAGFKSK